jgi:hypothetical protein
MVVVNNTCSFSLITYCIRYFYLTNRASIILVGEESLVLIRTNTVSLSKIAAVVVVWAFRSVAALAIAQA